jgi:hypothetical protein
MHRAALPRDLRAALSRDILRATRAACASCCAGSRRSALQVHL